VPREGGGVPVLPCSAADYRLVVALADGPADPPTFAYTGHGEVFGVWKADYHLHSERDYVSGYSPVLDALADLAAAHRGGGGHLHVWPDAVRCVECGAVVAWIGAGDPPRCQDSAPGSCRPAVRS